MLKIISLEGPAGAGKSTLCNRIKKSEQGIAYVDMDLIKVLSFLGSPNEWQKTVDELGPSWRRDIAQEVGLIWIEQLMQKRRPIIAEICATFMGDNRLEALVDQNKEYALHRALLFPSYEECLRRVEERNKLGIMVLGREKVHESYRYYESLLERNHERYTIQINTEKESVEESAEKIAKLYNSSKSGQYAELEAQKTA